MGRGCQGLTSQHLLLGDCCLLLSSLSLSSPALSPCPGLLALPSLPPACLPAYLPACLFSLPRSLASPPSRMNAATPKLAGHASPRTAGGGPAQRSVESLSRANTPSRKTAQATLRVARKERRTSPSASPAGRQVAGHADHAVATHEYDSSARSRQAGRQGCGLGIGLWDAVMCCSSLWRFLSASGHGPL